MTSATSLVGLEPIWIEVPNGERVPATTYRVAGLRPSEIGPVRAAIVAAVDELRCLPGQLEPRSGDFLDLPLDALDDPVEADALNLARHRPYRISEPQMRVLLATIKYAISSSLKDSSPEHLAFSVYRLELALRLSPRFRPREEGTLSGTAPGSSIDPLRSAAQRSASALPASESSVDGLATATVDQGGGAGNGAAPGYVTTNDDPAPPAAGGDREVGLRFALIRATGLRHGSQSICLASRLAQLVLETSDSATFPRRLAAAVAAAEATSIDHSLNVEAVCEVTERALAFIDNGELRPELEP